MMQALAISHHRSRYLDGRLTQDARGVQFLTIPAATAADGTTPLTRLQQAGIPAAASFILQRAVMETSHEVGHPLGQQEFLQAGERVLLAKRLANFGVAESGTIPSHGGLKEALSALYPFVVDTLADMVDQQPGPHLICMPEFNFNNEVQEPFFLTDLSGVSVLRYSPPATGRSTPLVKPEQLGLSPDYKRHALGSFVASVALPAAMMFLPLDPTLLGFGIGGAAFGLMSRALRMMALDTGLGLLNRMWKETALQMGRLAANAGIESLGESSQSPILYDLRHTMQVMARKGGEKGMEDLREDALRQMSDTEEKLAAFQAAFESGSLNKDQKEKLRFMLQGLDNNQPIWDDLVEKFTHHLVSRDQKSVQLEFVSRVLLGPQFREAGLHVDAERTQKLFHGELTTLAFLHDFVKTAHRLVGDMKAARNTINRLITASEMGR